jgi:hypothetical protein
MAKVVEEASARRTMSLTIVSSTDRIARTARNTAICRTFSRAMQGVIYRPPGIITARTWEYCPLINHL